MLSFNSQNYVVEHKKAPPQQWRGEVKCNLLSL